MLNAEAWHEGHPPHRYFLNRETRVLRAFVDMVCPFTENPESMARKILALAGGPEIQWLRCGCGFDLAEEWDRAVTTLFADAQDHGGQRASA